MAVEDLEDVATRRAVGEGDGKPDAALDDGDRVGRHLQAAELGANIKRALLGDWDRPTTPHGE